MAELGRLAILKMERDKLLINLRSVLNQMSNIQGLSMEDADLDLWTLITNRPTIQKRKKIKTAHKKARNNSGASEK